MCSKAILQLPVAWNCQGREERSFAVWVSASKIWHVQCVCVYGWTCKCTHMPLAGRTGVQGMIARLLSSKLLKVSCHHQHRYYLLTQTANVLQLCPWSEMRSRDGQAIFYLLCSDEIGLMAFTCVPYIVWNKKTWPYEICVRRKLNRRDFDSIRKEF